MNEVNIHKAIISEENAIISYTLNQNPQYNTFIKQKATKFDNLKLIEEVVLDGNNFK